MVIVDGQAGLPMDDARNHESAGGPKEERREVNVAALALRHSRAVALLAAALVVSGVIAALALAEQHLSAAAVSPHRHRRALGHAAAAVDVAHRDAADRAGGDGGARRPPRPLEEHPRRVGNLGAVRSLDRHGRRAADGAEPRRRDHRRPADRTPQLQVERMTPAIFPVFILSMTGTLPTADLYDYANFV